MKPLDQGICAAENIRTWGVKDGKYGLAIIQAEGIAAAVYTQNKIIAAPLALTKKHLESQQGKVKAILINSGNANAYTGKKGLKDAEKITETLAQKLKCKKEQVLIASTGIIGHHLNVDKITEQINEVLPRLESSSTASQMAAKAIMTTDTYTKEFSVETEDGIRIGGIAKGAGMIAPDMATMLAFICTDAKLPCNTLRESLTKAVNKSFNMAIVDGDTSTNDMTVLISTGEKKCSLAKFQEALDTVCIELARMIVKDGEGATKLIELTVKGAQTMDGAKKAVRTILTSPLVKTAIFGEDPNWGRIIAAAGRSGAGINPDKLTLTFSNKQKSVTILEEGTILNRTKDVEEIMKSDTINIELDLGAGGTSATGWGCDLTYDYVKINAEYTT